MRRLPLDFRDQYFGCEIELTGINRATAAQTLANLFGTRAEHSGGGYDAYRVKDLDGKEWKIVRDGSIHPECRRRSVLIGETYKVELNSPKLEWNLRFLRSVAYYLLHYRKKAGLLAQPSGSGSLLLYHDLCGKPGNHIQTVSAGGCVHAFRVLRIHPGGNPAQCDFDGFVRYDIRHTDLSAEQKRRFAVKLWHQVLSEA